MTSLLPPKKDVALALLERASVFVHLDPRAESVVVPPWLKGQPQLILQIGLNLAVDIPDLEVDEAGIACTLSFSRRPHHCRLPWNAVYALVGEDGRGMVWPADIPAEVAAQAHPVQSQMGRTGRLETRVAAPEGATRAPSSRPPNLIALEGSKTSSAAVALSRSKSQRSHLRLVK